MNHRSIILQSLQKIEDVSSSYTAHWLEPYRFGHLLLIETIGKEHDRITEAIVQLSLCGPFNLIAGDEWLPDRDTLTRSVRRFTVRVTETLDNPRLRRPATCLQLLDLLMEADQGNRPTLITNFLHHFYNAYITQFSQPDSIIPDLKNPQSFNRYAYALNNPIRHSDPTGHKVVEDIITGNTTSTKKQDEDPKYKKLNWFRKWAGYGSHTGCELSYKECFYDYSLLKLTDYQQVDSDQFDDLVYAVYYDLKKHDPGKYNPFDWMVRKHYDTPFWNGVYADKSDPDFVRIKPNPDNVVCVESRCNKRSDINYFAQGMWDAAMGRTLEQSLKTAQDYKEGTYPGQTLSDDAEYWIEYGYQAYQALDAAPTNP